jgi:hypothetical protein
MTEFGEKKDSSSSSKTLHKLFIKQLKDVAAEIEPLTRDVTSDTALWNGAQWATGNTPSEPDLVAVSWWSFLVMMAGLLEAQDTPLSLKQTTFMRRQLFGSMGSLTDVSFDARRLGPRAYEINSRLAQKRETLYVTFENLLLAGSDEEPINKRWS